MSRRAPLVVTGVAATLALAATAASTSVGAAAPADGAPPAVSAQVDPDPDGREQPRPTRDDERMRRELAELAEAWDVGGGMFGYPFWEKAGRRWTAGQLSTPIYREYATGYRDRLRAGCELLDAVDAEHDVARDVRDLVAASCRRRLDALRSQQRWLDGLIDIDTSEPAVATQDQQARAERIAELEAEAAEHEQAYRTAIQSSYRDARLAMDLAQGELDARGLERLAEDAFI